MTQLSSPPSAAARLPRVLVRKPPTAVWLGLTSIAACVFALSVFSGYAVPTLMGSRTNDISASIAVLDRGGPPLLRVGYNGVPPSDVEPYHSGIAASKLRPVGIIDDPGVYLYLPVLAEVTGERDPAVLMKWFFMGCFGLLVLVYPLLFYGIFRSAVVAIAAPLLLLWKFRFTEALDLYWILAWITLLGIPTLVLAYRWWRTRRRAAVALLVALMLAASFATSIRIHAGLAMLLGALGIVTFAGVRRPGLRGRLRRFWTMPGWWARPAVAGVLVVAYLAISSGGFAAVRAYRDHVIHQPNFSAAFPDQHPFWHNAYIGLGYLPNRHGLAWYDDVSVDAVGRAKPGTLFGSSEYEATLRHLYFDIARDDPGLLLRNYWIKTRDLVADAISRFWPAFVLLPFAAMIGRRRRLVGVALLVAVPAAVVSALGPILTIPIIQYEVGWLGTWGALWIFALASAWVIARDAATSELPPELEPLRRGPDLDAFAALRERALKSRTAWALAAAVVLTLALGDVARPAPPPSSSGVYAAGQSSFVDSGLLDKPALRTWDFAGRLPAGWSNAGGAYLERDRTGSTRDGLYVRSPMVTETIQLRGPSVVLPAGSYDLVTSGRAFVGGFGIWVIDGKNKSVVSSHYWWLQTPAPTQAMGMSFALERPTRVHVVVTSWSSFPNSSAWILWAMKLLSSSQHSS